MRYRILFLITVLALTGVLPAAPPAGDLPPCCAKAAEPVQPLERVVVAATSVERARLRQVLAPFGSSWSGPEQVDVTTMRFTTFLNGLRMSTPRCLQPMSSWMGHFASTSSS